MSEFTWYNTDNTTSPIVSMSGTVDIFHGSVDIAKVKKSWTQWGHCPFCFTDQDMLENQSCCTECGEPLEEGRVEDADNS